MRRILLLSITPVVFALAASSAQALSATYGGADCLSCDGAAITLEIIDNGGTFDVTLTLDSTGYDESREGLAQIGFGAIQDWTSVTLVSAPTALIAWSDPIESNIDAATLCNNGSTDNTDKICSWGFTDIEDDDEYVWEFLVTDGTLKLDTDEWHIGGQFADYDDLIDSNLRTPHGKVLSESGTAPVPEPTAAVVFGAGLLVAGRSLRRSR